MPVYVCMKQLKKTGFLLLRRESIWLVIDFLVSKFQGYKDDLKG